jgi:uncharacterized membrane protein (UPF0127 family)
MNKFILIGIGVVLIAAVVLFFFMHQTSTQTTVTIGSTDSTSSPQATIVVEVESTEATREQGLSGRASLAEGSGMLFVFQQPGTYGFWMKDMNFALDMIFADAQGRIVTVDQNLSPNSYNSQNPQSSKVFYPAEPIIYVLEIPAGFAASHNIKEGMSLQFK